MAFLLQHPVLASAAVCVNPYYGSYYTPSAHAITPLGQEGWLKSPTTATTNDTPYWALALPSIEWQLRYGCDARHTDDLATQGKLDTLHTDLGTLDGRVDGIEGKLDTLDSDLGTLDGRVDGIEGKLDTLHSDLVALTAAVSASRSGDSSTVAFSSGAQSQLDGNTQAVRADLWYALGVAFSLFFAMFLWKIIRPSSGD